MSVQNKIHKLIETTTIFDRFPYSLLDFLYYIADENPLNLNIKIEDLEIYTDKAGKRVNFKYSNASILKIQPKANYEQIISLIDESYPIKEIANTYFSEEVELNAQIAFPEDVKFKKRVRNYIQRNNSRLDDKFRLPLDAFLWFCLNEKPSELRINRLYVNFYDNKIILEVEDPYFSLHLKPVRRYVPFKDIKNFIHNTNMNILPFSKIISYEQGGGFKQYPHGDLGKKDIIKAIKILNHYFIKANKNPLQPIINTVSNTFPYEIKDIITEFNYLNITQEASVTVVADEDVELDDCVILINNIQNKFIATELDLDDYIIVWNNRTGFTYHSVLGSSNHTSFIFYFGIYPIEDYYAHGGIGSYKLRLKSLCTTSQYSVQELKKWYKELYPKRRTSNKTQEYMCRYIEKWINGLSTFDFVVTEDEQFQ